MAVTVTPAAPATTIDHRYVGYQGQRGSDVYIISDGALQGKALRTSQLTLSGTYVTGGFALTPSNYGLASIDGLLVICDAATDSGAAAVPVLSTAGASPNVKLVVDDTGTELTNATAVTNYRYTVLLFGSVL